MAGAAVNAGFYGLWRTPALLGPPPAAATDILLILVGITALRGIAHAAVQTSLQRVIAYSSVENTVLILVGFASPSSAATRDRGLTAIGLLAATLQIVAHTVSKSPLFPAAPGSRPPAAATTWTSCAGRCGGYPGAEPPWPSGLTLAGLPPTVGFVSEWFLLEAMTKQFRVPDLQRRAGPGDHGRGLALTAGFAGVTFVRLVGLIVLGSPAAPAAGA